MAAEKQYEIIADHQSAHGPMVTQVRGSLIASSLATLRANDFFDRYITHLPAQHHDQVLYVIAATWVPIDVAMAHYGACDAMQLTDAELELMGRSVSEKLTNTFMGTLVRTTRMVIAPRAVPLRHYPKVWERLFMGGGCTVSMHGETEARIESRGIPMFRYRYFRAAYEALIRGAGLMFRSSMNVRTRKFADDSLLIDLTWS